MGPGRVYHNTLNVATAATNASGFTTASQPPNILAVDYNIDYEHIPSARNNPQNAMFTWGPIMDFGATTSLDAPKPTLAYTIPNFRANECAQL